MRIITISFIFSIVVASALASAKQVPDSSASGDKRRVLEAGLRLMGAVSIPEKDRNGSYDGLYNVQCSFADSYPMLCKASTAEGPSLTIWNTTEGAVLVGSVLRMAVDNASNASIIKARKVECNSVGDECNIEGIEVQ